MSLSDNIASYINSQHFINIIKREKELELLRLKFIEKYPLKSILSLRLDNYVVGLKEIKPQGDDTFCYWIETRLIELGNIKGTPAHNKFGIYYGKTNKDPEKKYRTINKWGGSCEESFKNIKRAIYDLLIDGYENNLKELDQNKLAPVFKGKILSTYYPNKYISVCSEKHIDHFIYYLKISYLKHEAKSLFKKKQLLLDFKNNNNVMKEWSNHQFTRFLYLFYSPKKDIHTKTANKKKPKYVNFNYLESNSISHEGNVCVSKNYLKVYEHKQRLGALGESIVLNEEIERLKKLGKVNLAEKVNQVSKLNDSLGYDILSYDTSGKEKYIEVKSTDRDPESIDFYLTRNEYKKFLTLDNYYIYLVYNVKSNRPKIHILDNDKLTKDVMEAMLFKVKINTSIDN